MSRSQLLVHSDPECVNVDDRIAMMLQNGNTSKQRSFIDSKLCTFSTENHVHDST
jgi:hypothetical protein